MVDALVPQCTGEDREAALAAAWIAAFADGRLRRERRLLYGLTHQLQLPVEIAQRLEREARVGKLRITPPASESGQTLVFECVLQVIAADGKLHPRERQIVQRLGESLSLKPAEVTARLNTVALSTQEAAAAPAPTSATGDVNALLPLLPKATQILLPFWRRPAAILLIAVNLFPIIGVLFRDWDGFTIILLYWLETGLLGLVAVFKIWVWFAFYRSEAPVHMDCGRKQLILYKPKGPPPRWLQILGAGIGALLLGSFLGLHLGFFMYIHASFIFPVLTKVEPELFGIRWLFEAIWAHWTPGVTWGIVGFFVLHLFEFFYFYFAGREYLMTDPDKLMKEPYARVVVMHVTIIFGMMPVVLLGLPHPMLILLVLLKTGIDLHQQSRPGKFW
jgi:hypothetical protein